MPTNKQRQSTRAQLQRQLDRRREAEARRRKFSLVASVALTLVLIAGIVVAVVVLTSGKDTSGSGKGAASGCSVPAGATVSFDGVKVKNATSLKTAPLVTSASSTDPSGLQCQDLVVGSGKAASPSSTVSVQYTGVLYKTGTQFDSSWANGGKAVQFPLTRVVPGFTQGIGGTAKIGPMKVGGRRIMILPASLAYGSAANGKIPANSALVFVVDLTSVDS